jgi:hypothetical protein
MVWASCGAFTDLMWFVERGNRGTWPGWRWPLVDLVTWPIGMLTMGLSALDLGFGRAGVWPPHPVGVALETFLLLLSLAAAPGGQRMAGPALVLLAVELARRARDWADFMAD